MIALNTIILFLSIVIDVTFCIELSGVKITPHLSMLFLLYLGFRRTFGHVFIMVLIFIMLARPFMGLSLSGVALSYWGVLYVISRLRNKMFAESYVTHAAWVVLFASVLQWLSDFELNKLAIFHYSLDRIIEISANSFIAAILTVPFFIFWDSLFDAVGMSKKSIEV